MQFPAPWNQKRFDYTAVEVRKDVMETELKDNLPVPLSLMMKREGLHVKDMLYVVHYPEEKDFKRCENGEHIRVLNGELKMLTSVSYSSSTDTTMQAQNGIVSYALCRRPFHWSHCHHIWGILWKPNAEGIQQRVGCGRASPWWPAKTDQPCHLHRCDCG